MLPQLSRALRGNRDLSTFLACAALSFLCLSLPLPAKNAVSRVLSGGVLGPVKYVATFASEVSRVSEENAELRRIATELAHERSMLIEYRHENARLRELLSFLVSFPEEERPEMLPARVVGIPGGRVTESLELDKGRRHGLRTGLPVVVPDGLVGKVSDVFPERALVEPLTSATAGVSVVTERARVRGVVRPKFGGVSQAATWEIEYVQARSDVREGDLVVTSGLGGVYPPGIAVGSVTDVTEGPLTMSVGIELSVNLATVEQVFVLTGRTSSGGGTGPDAERLLRELRDLGGGEAPRGEVGEDEPLPGEPGETEPPSEEEVR